MKAKKRKIKLPETDMDKLRRLFNDRTPFRIPGVKGDWFMTAFSKSDESKTISMVNVEGRTVTSINFKDPFGGER